MNLNEPQRAKITAWINDGLKLADIQKRLETEFGLRLTYIEVRFLVDDLKLTPKDPVIPVAPAPPAPASAPAPNAAADLPVEEPAPPPPAPAGGKVTVTLDQLTKPGSLVSGSVTFSDGNTAAWHLNQFGQLGLTPQVPGYKPPAGDIQTFQLELQRQLEKMGF
jgi:hypothetical protein